MSKTTRSYVSKTFLSHGSTALVGLGLLIIEVSRSYSDTSHSVGLLWKSDRPGEETSTWQHTPSQQTSMPPAGFEPAIPASERPQTHASDRVTTAISRWRILQGKIIQKEIMHARRNNLGTSAECKTRGVFALLFSLGLFVTWVT